MLLNEPNRDWEKIGRKDPYFGVLRHKRYRTRNLTDATREQFFQSGEERVQAVISTVCRHLGTGVTPRRALDFGCGVGRLLIPLARVSEEITGVDISQSMLTEARHNCEARGVRNVHFARDLSQLGGAYDFIHSHIVFQHMRIRRGEAVFAQLLRRLAPGGTGVLHFTYAKVRLTQKLSGFLVARVPFGAQVFNLFKGANPFAPHLQMNDYRLNRLFHLLQREKITDLHVEFTDHGGFLGAVLYFKKP